MISRTRLIRRDDLTETYDCVADGITIGHISRSDRRWANGWIPVTLDNKDLGDQPRRVDAVATLLAYVESPFRR